MPQAPQQRQQFTEEFLSGAWVRFFSFCADDLMLLYYSLQPGRFGALFPVEGGGTGTAIVDVNSRMVLYVPILSQDGITRREPHPHVQTFYDEEVHLITLMQAQRMCPAVVDSILRYATEFNRMVAERLPPAACAAGYIHHPTLSSVPRDTKFAYIRKVFPDPESAFVLFRLSNMRSQVVCNSSPLDIRWQSDGRKHVGSKYYVYGDGRAEAFSIDTTGVLASVDKVLQESFRMPTAGH